MLRPHTFTQLQPSSFSFVLKNEQVLQPSGPKTSFHSSCSALSVMCPLPILFAVAKMDWIHRNFLKRSGRGDTLGKYLKLLASTEDPVSPHALRIGGRTWYLSHGMDRQFCDCLGTYKVTGIFSTVLQGKPSHRLEKTIKILLPHENVG